MDQDLFARTVGQAAHDLLSLRLVVVRDFLLLRFTTQRGKEAGEIGFRHAECPLLLLLAGQALSFSIWISVRLLSRPFPAAAMRIASLEKGVLIIAVDLIDSLANALWQSCRFYRRFCSSMLQPLGSKADF